MRKFLLIFLMVKCVFSALDLTTVDANFDARGFPIFKNSNHKLNWCLDRLKPSKFIISNNSSAPAQLNYTIQQKGRDWDFQKIMTPFDGHSFRECLGLDSDGSLIFSEREYKKLKISSFSSSYFSLFQTARVGIGINESFEFDIPFGWLRQAKLGQNYKIEFENEGDSIRLSITDGPDESLESTTEFLSTLYSQECLDSGKKAFRNKVHYAFHDWESLSVNEEWFGSHRKFLLKFYEIHGLTLENVVGKRKKIIEKSRNILRESLTSGDSASVGSECLMPKIIHRIWIASKDTPATIPADRLQHYLAQVKANPTFQHILWVIDKEKIPYLTKGCPEIVDYITIRSFDEIWARFRGKDLFSRLFQNSRYTACSDVARANLIYQFGGIYADFGVDFKISPLYLCRNFNIFMMRELFLLSGTSLGAMPEHTVFDKTLEFFDNIDRFPVEDRSIGHGNPLVPWCAYGILTAMFDIYSSEDDRFFPIPFSKLLIDINQMHSWGGPKAVHGQKSTSSNPVSDSEWFGPKYITPGDYTHERPAWDWVTHKMSSVIFGKGVEHISVQRLALVQNSARTYQQVRRDSVNAIPHISHRCWLTNPRNPVEAPKAMLSYYIDSLKLLNLSKDWKHYFWCLQLDLIPETIAMLSSADVGIEIKTLADLPSMKGRHVFDAYLEDSRYTNANDILRMNIINTHGGLYCDLGVELKRNLTQLIDDYHYFLLLAGEGYIDHTIIAASPSSEVVSAYLKQIDELYLQPEEVRAITVAPPTQLSWTGCNYMASYIDCRLSRDTKILFVKEADGLLVQLHRMGSWNQVGKFGNKRVQDTTLNIFSLRPSAAL